MTQMPVSRETEARLAIFETEFLKWSSRINLASPMTLTEFRTRHIKDSLQLYNLAPKAKHWVDIGTGGGLPGMVLAAVLEDIAGSRVDLVESNRKKTAFLQAIRPRVAPSVHVHPRRIEGVIELIPRPDVISARALAPLDMLLSMVAPWLQSGARALFHKGRGYRQEIDDSKRNWAYELTVHGSQVDEESVVLEITDLVALTDR